MKNACVKYGKLEYDFKDKEGRDIHFSQGIIKKILSYHPDMALRIGRAVETVENYDKYKQDTFHFGGQYYKSFTEDGNNFTIKVATHGCETNKMQGEKRLKNHIVTAFEVKGKVVSIKEIKKRSSKKEVE